MNVPRNCRYSKDHFWVKPEGNEAVIGVSDYFQGELGHIVFVDLPEIDDDIVALGTFGIIESDRMVADLIAPVTGTVIAIGTGLVDDPELINEDPYGEGWLARVELDDPVQLDVLLAPEDYEDYIADLGEEE
ncbi:MAG: glycine cleavage system protein GcvH [bacterium]|nr:glycine cleavage system protein GcvH [bacterium]MDT8396459.1 glycine cleavage system protein GcvH [bacterium]